MSPLRNRYTVAFTKEHLNTVPYNLQELESLLLIKYVIFSWHYYEVKGVEMEILPLPEATDLQYFRTLTKLLMHLHIFDYRVIFHVTVKLVIIVSISSRNSEKSVP